MPNDDELKTNEVVIENSKVKHPQIVSMLPITIPPPFLKRLKKKDNSMFKKFFDKFSYLSINISLIEALQKLLGYAKFMKELVSKKWLVEEETILVIHHCSTIMSSTMAEKKEDPDSFPTPCTIKIFKLPKVLCDLTTSIKIMTYTVFHNLRSGNHNLSP